MPRILADLAGTNQTTFRIGQGPARVTVDASACTVPRTLLAPDADGTIATQAYAAAQAAAAQAYAIQRANHTGTQAAATISDFAAAALTATAAAYDVAGAAAAAQAYAIQRANHTGTQAAATISDFAAAALAATVSAYQPLNVNLTALASDYDGATKTLTHNISKAATSAGLALQANNGTLVVTLGPGGGAGAAFADGVTCASLTATGANGVATVQAATQDGVRLLGRAGGTSSYVGTLTVAPLGASRTYTLPDASLTFAGQNIDNAFSLAQTFAGSAPGTPSAGQVLIGGGAIKAGGAISGASGTAAAPGLRTSTYAHGLYSASASGLGLAAAGAAALNIVTGDGATYGPYVAFATPSAAEWNGFFSGRSDSYMLFSGSTGSGTGGQFRIYGSAHATKPSYVEFTRGATVSAYFDNSGNLICSGTVTVTNGTAAAPGLRLTSEAHGLYRASATSLGFAVAGTAAASLTSAGVFSCSGLSAGGSTLPTSVSGLYWTDRSLAVLDNLRGGGGIVWGAGAIPSTSVSGRVDAAVASTRPSALVLLRSSTASLSGLRVRGGTAVPGIGDELTDVLEIWATGTVRVLNADDATTEADGSVRLSGGLSQADGKQIVQGATSFHYWGPSGTDGSWRFGRSGNDFVIQRRESAAWVTKQTIAA